MNHIHIINSRLYLFLVAGILSSLSLNAQIIGGSGSGSATPAEVKPGSISSGGFQGDVSLFNGTYQTSYNLGTVSTVSGLSYTASLSYNSSFTSGNNLPHTSGIPYGEGWSVNIPTISINTSVYRSFMETELIAIRQARLGASRPDDSAFTPYFYDNGNCDKANEEGDVYWYDVSLNIPGVISEKLIFTGMRGSSFVFHPHKFERFVEVIFFGGVWEVLLDNGTQYRFVPAVRSNISPSNQRVQEECETIMDLRSLILPKEAITTWYCGEIWNKNKVGKIRFEYDTYGCYDYHNEINENDEVLRALRLLDGPSAVGSYDQLKKVCSDIILKEINAEGLERLVFEHESIASNNNTHVLKLNSTGVSRKDSMYSFTTMQEWSGQQLSAWDRYCHIKSDDANFTPGSQNTNTFTDPNNPYKGLVGGPTGGEKYLKRKAVVTSSGGFTGANFNHAYLQSPRIGQYYLAGDTYELQTEMKVNSLFSPLIDINIASGNNSSSATGPNSSPNSITPVDSPCYDEAHKDALYSTFGNSIKWFADPNNGGILTTSNVFSLPSTPTSYEGFAIQIGPGISDNRFSEAVLNEALANEYLPDQSYYNNLISAAPGNTPWDASYLLSGDNVPQNFGIGIPLHQMKGFYDKTSAYNSYNGSNFWYVNNSAEQFANVPTALNGNDVKLNSVKLIRHSKNPYMLKAVKKYVLSGGTLSDILSGTDGWRKVSHKEMAYDEKLVGRTYNFRNYSNSPDQHQDEASGDRLIFRLISVSELPSNVADPTTVSDSEYLITRYKYDEKSNNSAWSFDTLAIAGYKLNTNYVLLKKIVDSRGKEIKIHYYPIGTGNNHSYNLLKMITPLSLAEIRNPPQASACSLPHNYRGRDISVQTNMVVSSIAIKDGSQFKLWDYEYEGEKYYNNYNSFSGNFKQNGNWGSLQKGFKTTYMTSPPLEGSGERFEIKYQHYTDEEDHLLWGMLSSVETFDPTGQLVSSNSTDYSPVLAIENAILRASNRFSDYEEYYDQDRPERNPSTDFNQYIANVHLFFTDGPYNPINTNPDFGSLYEGPKFYESRYELFEGNASNVLSDCYFIRKDRDVAKNYDGQCGNNNQDFVESITEYKYYDAYHNGRLTDNNHEGYNKMGIGIELEWHPSFQLFETYQYSPQLPDAYTKERYYYYWDYVNHPTYTDASTMIDPFYKDLSFLIRNLRLRSLPFQKTSIQKAAGENEIKRSEYYIFKKGWEQAETNVTYLELDIPEPECGNPNDDDDDGTIGNPNDPGNDCIIVKGGGTVPSGYCLLEGSVYVYCLCDHPSVPVTYPFIVVEENGSRAAPSDGVIRYTGDPFEDDEVNARLVSNVTGKFMMEKVVRQLLPVVADEVIQFDADLNPQYPSNGKEQVTNLIVERNEYGQIVLEENIDGLQTFYDFGQRTYVSFPSCYNGVLVYLRLPLNNHPGLPDAVEVGHGLPNVLRTEYEYTLFNTVSKVTDPNGIESTYNYDEFSRLEETFANGELLTRNSYAHWDNQLANFTNSFETRTLSNVVSTETFLSNNSSFTDEAFIDPIGRTVATRRDGNLWTSNTIFDAWDRPFQNIRAHYNTTPYFTPNSASSNNTQQILFESSPRQRPLRQVDYGRNLNKWREHSSTAYCIATSSEVNSLLTSAGHTEFPYGSLFFKTTTLDEDKRKNVSFTNALGQIVVTIMGEEHGTVDCPIRATVFFYDSFGNPRRVLNPKQQPTTYDYNYLGQLFSKTTPESGTDQYTYDPSGRIIVMKDANNRLTLHQHDLFSRPISQHFSFSPPGNLFSNEGSLWITEPQLNQYNNILNNPGSGLEKEWFYDAADPAYTQLSPSGIHSKIQALAVRGKGRLVQLNSYKDFTDEPIQIRYIGYNARGFIEDEILQFNPNGISSSAKGMLTQIHTATFNRVGSPLTEEIDLGVNNSVEFQYEYAYDNWNRLEIISTKFGQSSTESYRIADYSYDDILGRVAIKKYYGNQSNSCRNEEVQSVSYSYDTQERLTAISSGLLDFNLYYDQQHNSLNNNFKSTNYNGNINTTAAYYKLQGTLNDPGTGFASESVYNYLYDRFGQLTNADAFRTGKHHKMGDASFEYDVLGNMTRLIRYGEEGYANHERNEYLYAINSKNQLASINRIHQCGSPALDRSLSYDFNGNLKMDTKKGITQTVYSRANLPEKVRISSKISTNYYDGSDQRIYKYTKQDRPAPQADVVESAYYSIRRMGGQEIAQYDLVNNSLMWYVQGQERLARIDHHSNVDLIGNPSNIREIFDHPVFTAPSELAALPSLLSNLVSTIQSAGSSLSFPAKLYKVDNAGNISYIWQANYSSSNGTILETLNFKSGYDIVSIKKSENDALNTSLRELTGLQYPIISGWSTKVPQPHYYLYDHLGNTRIVFQAAISCGSAPALTLDHVLDYFPYGKVLQEYVNGDKERYLTTQHERDEETGLDYRGARFYDADVGRFLSVDPLAADFAAWSAYNYVLGNPVSLIDPDGRAPEDIIIRNSSCSCIDEFVNTINENFNGQFQAFTEDASDGSTRLRIEATKGGGDLSKLSEGQQAFYKSINDVAEVQTGVVNLEIVSGDSKVHTGRYSNGKIDIKDVQQFPQLDPNVSSQDGPTQAGKIVHEVKEQFFKQVVDGNRNENTKGFGNDNYGNHGAAIQFEDEVNGNSRKGNTYTKPDGTKHLYNVGTNHGVISVTKKKID